MADGEFCGRNNVRRWCVDHHDSRRRCRLDVDVVEANSGAGDDNQLLTRFDDLGVDRCRAANEQRPSASDGLEQCVPVGAINVANVETRPERTHGCGRKLLGDQHDGFSHGVPIQTGGVTKPPGRGAATLRGAVALF